VIKVSDVNYLLYRVGLEDRLQEQSPIWPAIEMIVDQLVKRIEQLEAKQSG
jgi:hypothetical protein